MCLDNRSLRCALAKVGITPLRLPLPPCCYFLMLFCHFCSHAASVAPEELFGGAADLFSVSWSRDFSDFRLKSDEIDHLFLASDKALILTATGQLIFGIDPASGNTLWKRVLEYDQDIQPTNSPSNLLVSAASGALNALDLETGDTRWTREFPSRISHVVANDTSAIIITAENTVVALNPADGNELWTHLLRSPAIHQPALSASICLLSQDSDTLTALNLQDGSPLWELSLPENAALQPLLKGHFVYAMIASGTVYALSATTGSVLWTHEPNPDGYPHFFPIDSISSLHISGHFLFHLQPLPPPIGSSHKPYRIDSKTGLGSPIYNTEGSLAGIPIDVSGFQLLPLMATPRRLSIFSQTRGYVINSVEISPYLSLFAQSNSTIYFCSRQLFGNASVHPAQLEHIPEGSFAVRTYPNLLIVAAILLPLLASAIFMTRGKPRLPPVHETSLRLFTLAFLMLMFYLLLVISATILIQGCIVYRLSPFAIWFSFLLLSPGIIILLSYTVGYGYILRTLLHKSTAVSHAAPTLTRIYNIVDSLTTNMGLALAPKILLSSTPNTTPRLLGCSQKNALLILSENIQQLVNRACQDDNVLAYQLLRLVIAHELAHIRNGDIWATPMLHTMHRHLPLWLLTLLFSYFLNTWFHLDNGVNSICSPVLQLLIPTVFFLVVVFKSTLRERETLADATAALFVNPDSLKELTTTQGEGMTPLEHFLFSVRGDSHGFHTLLSFSGPLRNATRYRSRPRLSRTAGQLQDFHKRAVERGNSLALKVSLLFGNRLIGTGSALVVGTFAGFLLLIAEMTIKYGFLLSLFTLHSDGRWKGASELLYFLTAPLVPGGDWQRTLGEGTPWEALGLFFMIGAATSTGCMLLVRVRNTPLGIEMVRLRFLLTLIWQLLIIGCSCLLVFYVLRNNIETFDYFGKAFEIWPGYVLTLLPLVVLFLVFMLHNRVSMEFSVFYDLPFFIASLVIVLTITIGVGLTIFSQLTAFGRVLWILFGLFLSHTLSIIGGLLVNREHKR